MKTYLKTFLPLIALIALIALTGCMMPNANRLIPENKSSRIRLVNPFYGYIEIDTRVVGDPNVLPPLPDPTPIVGPAQPVQPVTPFVRPNTLIPFRNGDNVEPR